jgi:hypothetical protein
MNISLIRQPSAFFPIGMSIAARLTVLYYVARYGIARQTDEGAAAHIWQLLMAGQIPVVVFYAVKWLTEGCQGSATGPRNASRRSTRSTCSCILARVVTAGTAISAIPHGDPRVVVNRGLISDVLSPSVGSNPSLRMFELLTAHYARNLSSHSGTVAQSCRLPQKVIPFRYACRSAGGKPILCRCGLMIAGHFE